MTITVIHGLILLNISKASSVFQWGMIDKVQIYYMIPLLMLYIPQNLITFIKSLRISLLILNIPIINEYQNRIFNVFFSSNNIWTSSVTSVNYNDEGFSNYAMVSNFMDTFQPFFVTIILFAIVFASKGMAVIILFTKKLHHHFSGGEKESEWSLQTIIFDISQSYKFNAFIRVAIEEYLEVCIVCFLSILKSTAFKFWTQVWSSIISLLILVLVVAFPLSILYYAIKDRKKVALEPELLLKRHWAMFEDLKNKKFFAIIYNFLFLFKWFTFALIVVFLQFWPLAQCISMIVLFTAFLLYAVIIRPFDHLGSNI